MKNLTKREEILLLSIGNLGANAYLVSIRAHISELTDKEWSISAIHIPLRRLEEAGFIESFYGGSTATRGGRRKKIYKITKMGMDALLENKRLNDILWDNFSQFDLANN